MVTFHKQTFIVFIHLKLGFSNAELEPQLGLEWPKDGVTEVFQEKVYKTTKLMVIYIMWMHFCF